METRQVLPPADHERRISPRTLIDSYYSVQFCIRKEVPTYQFKLRDVSKGGLCIAVRQDSALMEHLQAGQVHRLRYAPMNAPGQLNEIHTQIRHITFCTEGLYKDHFLVGLAIIDDEKSS